MDIPILERIGRGRMAGRGAELRLARGMWAKVQAGRSEFLVISGEAGIGKTRLVRELITQARVSKGVVLQAWNDNHPTQPFAAFRQILRTTLEEMQDPVGHCPPVRRRRSAGARAGIPAPLSRRRAKGIDRVLPPISSACSKA